MKKNLLLFFGLFILCPFVFAENEEEKNIPHEILERTFGHSLWRTQESSPNEWPEDWWQEAGSEEEWSKAFELFLNQNPSLKERILQGERIKKKYHEELQSHIKNHLSGYPLQTDTGQKIYASFVNFLKNQKKTNESKRTPAEADVYAKEETMRKYLAARQIPYEQWRSHPEIWDFYTNTRGIAEEELVFRPSVDISSEALNNWKTQSNEMLESAIIKNVLTAYQLMRENYPKSHFIRSRPRKIFSKKYAPQQLKAEDLMINDKGEIVFRKKPHSPLYLGKNKLSLKDPNMKSGVNFSFDSHDDSPLASLLVANHQTQSLINLMRKISALESNQKKLSQIKKELQESTQKTDQAAQDFTQNFRLVHFSGPQKISEKLNHILWSGYTKPWSKWIAQGLQLFAPTIQDLAQNKKWNQVKQSVRKALFALVTSVPLGMVLGGGLVATFYNNKPEIKHSLQVIGDSIEDTLAIPTDYIENIFYPLTEMEKQDIYFTRNDNDHNSYHMTDNEVSTPGYERVDLSSSYQLNEKPSSPQNKQISESDQKRIYAIRHSHNDKSVPQFFDIGYGTNFKSKLNIVNSINDSSDVTPRPSLFLLRRDLALESQHD